MLCGFVDVGMAVVPRAAQSDKHGVFKRFRPCVQGSAVCREVFKVDWLAVGVTDDGAAEGVGQFFPERWADFHSEVVTRWCDRTTTSL